ncbi:uncharacterized protein cep295 [Centroberyx affinis]|uniref:uncharacterized protein cep295 n=1 Tax=Centroberyx affinis TaxID=166261 RepID=UPI003A5C65AA
MRTTTVKLTSAANCSWVAALLFVFFTKCSPGYFKMKRKVARIRLSPNEEAQLIREEHERRRKLRIQQVREQERNISLQIRREVQRRRQSELRSLEEQLREDWERQQRDKLLTLQSLYQESLQLLGQGHRSAKENEPDWEAIAQREEENHAKAEERYREALKELKSQRQKDHEEQNRSIKARKKALQAEKERSAKVASLPPPPPNPIENIESKKRHVVKKFDVNAFAATHYHMPEATVDREADTTQPDAREGAEQEVRRLQELGREAEREREEQLEKARLRGKHALRREQLMQDRERLLVELEHMQQTDLLRRRQQVSQMPPQIFQPLYKRQEMRDDCQREMEFAFEDMYTGERRVKGDLVLQLVPEPLPAPSTGSQDQELDVTLDEDVTPAAEHTHRDAEQETSARAEPSRPAPRRALRKLLDRIRSQRDQRSLHSGRVPAADPPTADPPPPAAADQIPERDTTIDTGSLTSEERDAPLPEPRSPPALETTEESMVAGTLLLPDVLANRIQEFEEERKKREEELEREKEQQVALLQELEEQKARLEQMLQEAQQERENLTAAVTQEVPVRQPEVPVHDREVASATPGLDTEPVFPAGEDTRRIREYQQRLLEQNRLHKRSVEVARQRLEEYQRALRIRHNMTATSMLPPAVPAGLLHPPLHRTEGAAPISPPLQLPTGSAVSLPVQLESSDRTGDQRAGVPVRLADDMMERVTEHLPERLRPSSLTLDPLNHRPVTTLHPPANVPLRPGSDSIQAMSPNITDGPPPLPGRASLKPGTFLRESSQSGAPDMERQRRELQEVQRRVLQQREEMERQQEEERRRREEERQEEEERQRQEEGRRRQEEEERRKQERLRQEEEKRRRQEEERWRQEEERRRRREEEEEEERWRQEERLRQEEERDQMRRQREALQALISADAQPAAEADSEVLVSEDIGETRLQLLASLLRAIEESNGGTLSHLEEHQDQDGTAHQEPSTSDPPAHQSDTPAGPAPPSLLPPGLHLPPRVPKPPVSRVRLGVMEMMTEQHELSAIQEVETPVNASLVTGPEESVKLLPHAAAWDPQEESESSVASDRLLHSPSLSSGGQRSAGRATGSGRSSEPSWRERLLTGAGSSPSESPEPDSVLRILSPPSSDSGRGDDYSGPAVASCRSPTESAHRPPDPDCLSSTISTGSYITTDPEQNSSHTVDNSPPLTRLCVERGAGGGGSPPDASSPSSQSSCSKDGSAAAPPSPAVDSLFHDSSIQRIIDKYTRELNISLHTAGNTTASSADGEVSYLEEPSCSVSQQSWVGVPERRDEEQRPADCQPLPSDTETGAQSHGLEWDNTVNQILERFSDRVSSLAQDQDQDSFRPLIGQLADESSCLDPDRRDSSVAQLIGQPSAHSSMIAQLPGQSVSLSSDQGGWDSTLSRMIGRLSHRSSGRWQSGGQDFYAGRLIGRMDLEPSSVWLDEAQEESRMRPLLGELDESAGHRSGSSGERTSVDLCGSAQAGVPSDPASSPEARSHSSSVPGLNPQDQILQTSSGLPEAGPETSEVFPASDSFHPLLAEVTHNETVDASMTFHLPVQEAPSSPEGSGQSPGGERGLSPRSEEESETHAEPSVESEPSPERFRAEEPSSASALQESFCQLATSQCQPQESVLMVSAQEAELATLSLSGLTLCDAPPALDLPPPEGGDAEEKSVSDRPGRSGPVSDLGAGEPNTQQGSNLRNAAPVWDKIMDTAGEKGILEQSEITLLSLTDSTLQDQEETIIEEEECPDETREEGEKAEELESTLLPEETPVALKEESTQTHAATLLQFEWGPSGGLQEAFQQKRSALLQRSSRRVEQFKTNRAAGKTQPEVQGPSEAQRQSKAEEPRPISCKAKTKSEPQLKANAKPKREQAEDQTTEAARFVTTGSSKQKKTQLPPPVSDTRLKKVGEVRLFTPEQRKRDVSEMHQRTQRLYEQLEEVKQQKERRSRQEANANNRLKAKEFHKKTLQKLRAKQTHQ